jgi:uncharacterized protein HemX
VKINPKIYLVCMIVVVLGLTLVGVYASPQEKKYEPTETETLQLQLAQAHAQLAQQQFNYAQMNLQKAAQEFNDAATKIIKAHKWPEDLRVDPNTLAFTEAPKPAPATPPAPPAK